MVVFRRLLIGLVIVGGLAAAGATAAPEEYNPVRHHPLTEPEEGVQRILVKLRGTADTAALASRSHLSLKSSRHILSGLHALHVQPQIGGQSLAETLAALRADPAVEYAEPDRRRYAHATPNDPLLTAQWFLQADQPSAINAVGAWDVTTGSSGIVIAELDTGIRFDHPDLRNMSANRLLPGYDFVSADPSGQFLTANDGDGRDPDPSDPGDWISQSDTQMAQFKDCDVANSSWHGTRVGGILGAITNNSMGIAGITWSNWILPVRVLGKCGGYDSDIMAAMLWAAGVHVDGVPDNRYPAQVINMSLGATGSCPAGYSQVIGQLRSLGVLVVVSAGNEGGPVDAPANCSGAAGIAGLRQVGTKVGFSSLGPEIALSAPGGNCVNTTGGPCLFSLDTTTNTGTTTPGTNTYTDQTNFDVGTSFSAPIVAGIAGLMLAVNGNLNSSQLIARLQEGATKPFPVSTDPTVPQCHVPAGQNDLQTAECSCTTQVCGAGMANAQGAVAAALRPIAAAAVPASVAAGTNVTLNGSGSAAACNHTIASYAWTVVSPTTNPPAVQNANTASATVVAPVAPSTYTLRLTVTDDAGRSDSADVVVTSASASSTAAASAGSNACPTPISFSTSSPSSGGSSGGGGGSGGSGGGGGGGVDLVTLLIVALAAGNGSSRRYRIRAAASSHDR
jgi:serine protease